MIIAKYLYIDDNILYVITINIFLLSLKPFVLSLYEIY